MALDDGETIDQIVLRRQAQASCDAAEAQDVLDYVDRARAAGERISEAQGRRRADSAVHELSLAMRHRGGVGPTAQSTSCPWP